MNSSFDTTKTAHFACIWMHGLGASGDDMRQLAGAMQLNDLIVHHVFLDAPARPVTINQGVRMPAWYDIVGVQLNDREDEEGISASFKVVQQAIDSLLNEGFRHEQIILAGFSQGAAMTLYSALNLSRPLAGAIALSGYLPLAATIKPIQPSSLPIYIGYGRYDNIVMPAWTQQTVKWLEEKHYQALTVEDYPIDHSVCAEEIVSISNWIANLKEQA